MLCNTKVGFPVFDSTESAFDATEFILCGGGGPAKSGVRNCVMTCTLGPRPDGIPGVSLLPLATYDTGEFLATSCCTVSPNTFCLAIDYEIILVERGAEQDAFTQRARTCVAKELGLIEIVRTFNSKIFVATEKGALLVFALDFTLEHQVRLHMGAIGDLSFSPAYCASCSADSTLRVWDLKQMETEAILCAKPGLVFRESKFLPNNKLVALQVPKNRKGDCFVSIWMRRDSKTGGEFVLRAMRQVSPTLATGMAVNTKFVGIGTTEAILLFDTETLALLKRVNKVHGLPVTGLFFRGKYLVSTSADATAAMVSVEGLSQGGGGGGEGKRILAGLAFALVFILTLLAICVVVLTAKDFRMDEEDSVVWETALTALFDRRMPMNLSRVDFANVQAMLGSALQQQRRRDE